MALGSASISGWIDDQELLERPLRAACLPLGSDRYSVLGQRKVRVAREKEVWTRAWADTQQPVRTEFRGTCKHVRGGSLALTGC